MNFLTFTLLLSLGLLVSSTPSPTQTPAPTATSPPTSPPTPRPTPSCDAELTNLSDCLNDGIADGTCLPAVTDLGGCLIAGTYAACDNVTPNNSHWNPASKTCFIQCPNFNNGGYGILCSSPASAPTLSPAAEVACSSETDLLGNCIIGSGGVEYGSCAPLVTNLALCYIAGSDVCGGYPDFPNNYVFREWDGTCFIQCPQWNNGNYGVLCSDTPSLPPSTTSPTSPTMTKSPTAMPTGSAATGIVSVLIGLGGVGVAAWFMF
ncbi:hypothetical protein TrLO_g7522 [Triparma laevis f. longispina]|uniref:Uncharacterized protein n=1 Tax=Triparma laevis f. longispina TaxID=1714387 RepID=A0A9W7CKE4_9STRA|nr:hypothetical protein TrLO_g7522 [Triparma laevis f. longispina]